MTTSWSVSDSYYTLIDEGFYQETLDAGVYTLIYTNHGPVLKKESDSFKLPEKIYGLNDTFINRVIKTYYHKEGNNLGVLLYGVKGTGKQMPVSEPVLTPKGWSVMGALRPNDYVIGSDGNPTKVLTIHPQGIKDIYTVVTSDGVKIRCGQEHLWSVWVKRHGVETLITKTTQELIEGFNKYKYRLPKFNGLQQGLSVDYAYALGYCLGNSCFSQGQLTVSYHSNTEQDIIKLLTPTLGIPTNTYINGNFAGRSAYSWSTIHPEIAKYRNSGLSGDKHLLKEHSDWLLWDYNSRLELLQGLLDSDGTVGAAKDGKQRTSFSSTSINLLILVRDIVRSLGGRASEIKFDNRKHYKSGFCGQVSFKISVCPFKLRSEKWRVPRHDSSCTIQSIIKENKQEEQVCITVEASDHLYVTTGFKLTHNSMTAQLLCNRLELPVIVVKTTERISGFINSIQQDAIVLIDEFEKIYDRKNEHSSDLLSLLDGLNTAKHKRLFILTCNELFINDNLLDRPGRIRYKKEYNNLPEDIVKEIIDDKLTWTGNLVDITQHIVTDLVETVSSLSIVTIDIVIALIEEVNLHEELASVLMTDFNLKKNISTFNVIKQLILTNRDGTTYLAPKETVADITSLINYKNFTKVHCNLYVDNYYCGDIVENINETKSIVKQEVEYKDILKDPYLKKYLKELNLENQNIENDKDINIQYIYTVIPLMSRNIYSYL